MAITNWDAPDAIAFLQVFSVAHSSYRRPGTLDRCFIN